MKKVATLFIVGILCASLFGVPLLKVKAQQATLSDNFATDNSLNTSLWQVNGQVGSQIGTHLSDIPSTLVTPTLTFSSTNGMEISGVTSAYQSAIIQSVQSFSSPFTVVANVMGASPTYAVAFLLGIASADLGHGVVIDANLASSSGYLGIWYQTSSSVNSWTGYQGPIVSNPSLNVLYQVSISVDSSGIATLTVSSGGNNLGTTNAEVGTGNFYVILGQREGAPFQTGSNTADWHSVSVTSTTASTNLIQNSGFEAGLLGWSTSQGSAVYSADSSITHSGTFSAKGVETSTGSLGRLYQDVTDITSPGNQYQISGWIKTNNAVGYVVIALDYAASSGWTPADGYVKEIGYVTGTQDWTFFQSPVFTLPTKPSDADALWFLFDFNNGTGTAWWDDVSLVSISGTTASQSSTSVAISPNPAAAGSPVTCTATVSVSGSNPEGTISWTSSSSTGHFSSSLTSLTSGRSSTIYTDTSAGAITITASYSGDQNNSPSNGNKALTISPTQTANKFSIFWITDTQHLSNNDPSKYSQLTNWIASNWKTYNGQMVIHTGDIVDDDRNQSQWTNANTAMSILLNNNIPYCWCAGNHDNDPHTYDPPAGYWLAQNPNAYDALNYIHVRGVEQSNWVSDYDNGENTAVKFSADGFNFLIINIEWNASPDVFQTWIPSFISSYSNYQTIIATHAFIDNHGKTHQTTDTTIPYPSDNFVSNMEALLSGHHNVFLTLNGHFITDIGNNWSFGNASCLMFNRQGFTPDDRYNNPSYNEHESDQATQEYPDGAAAVTILTFDPANGDIQVKTTDLNLNGGKGGPLSDMFSFPASNYQDSSHTTLILPWSFASTSASLSHGTTNADQTEKTGISVNITGSSAQDGTSLTITTNNYGTTLPASTGALQVNQANYYDVQVSSTASLGSNTVAFVSISNPDFTSQSAMSFWNGTSWVPVPSTFLTAHTVMGVISVSDLAGTPIMVSSPSPFVIPQYSLVVIFALIACLVAFAAFAFRRNKKKGKSKGFTLSTGDILCTLHF